MPNTSKCKKDDYLVLEVVHTSTGVGFATKRYMTWHIARVESATKDGIAKTVRLSPAEFNSLKRIDDTFRGRLLCLPDEMQRAARVIYIAHPEMGFDGVSEITAALRMEYARAAA